jgi:hypothetical protein
MTDPSPSSSQGNATSPLNGIVGKTLAALERDFVTVGQRRLRSSYAWLVIGLVGGIVAGILFVASRTPLTPSPSFPLPSLHFPTSSAVTIGPKLVPSSGAYLGTWPKPHNGRRTNAEEIAYLESQIGRTFDIEHEYYRWDNAFPTSATQRIVNEGRIPFISWNARRNDGARNCWKDIANGAQDSWIRERARAVKNFNGGKPLFLVFHHEPEDDVGTCGGDLRGTIEEYKAAWRHIVGIFRAEGATNAVWVWVLMSATFDSGNAAQYYPGDSYVDWIAVDGYNWYPGKPGSQWRSFQKIFEPFYQWSSTAHSSANHTDLTKPLMIAEWGVQEDTATPDPNRKAQWFLDAIPVVKNWPKIKALVYFHSDLAYPWWLDSSSASLSAFKTMAKDPYFNPRTTSGSDTTPPATPQGLSASPGDREVTLSWIANTEPDLNNYAIQWKQSSDSTWTLISGIDKTLTSYTVTGLTNGVSYDFRIQALDMAGNISGWSAIVEARPVEVKPPWVGLGTRSTIPSTSLTTTMPFIDHIVLNIPWADLESADQVFDGAGWQIIDQALADPRNFKLRLRITAGGSAPNWVKRLGHAPVSAPTFDCSTTGGIAIYNKHDDKWTCSAFFWTTPVLDEYEELMREVARRYEGNSRVLEVVNSACMTLYAEPFYRAHSDLGSNLRLFNAGLNANTDLACQERAMQIHNALFPSTRTSLAVNPWDIVDGSPDDGKLPASQSWLPVYDFVTRWKSIMGPRLVLQNNGLGEDDGCPTGATPTTDHFCFLASVAPSKGFQTETWERLGGTPTGLYGAIGNGLSMGACFIELPSGFGVSDPATLQMYDSQLTANCMVAGGDTTKPSVSITSPLSGASVSGIVSVTATAFDNVGVTAVEFFVDGISKVRDTTAPYEYLWDTSGLPIGSSYVITAQALDASGNVGTSAAITITIADMKRPVFSGIAVSDITQTSAVVSWTTDEPATSRIQYGLTTAYGSFTTLDTSLVTVHRQVLSGLSSGTTYHYRVVSTDAAGNIAYSTDQMFTTVVPSTSDTVPPAAISDLHVTSITQTSVILVWTAPGDDGMNGTAASYDLRYAQGTLGDFDSATSVTGLTSPKPAGQAETFIVVDLTPGTRYAFGIKTRDEVSNTSLLSNIVSATTLSSSGGGGGSAMDTMPPAPPENLSVLVGDGQVALSWKNPSALDFVRVVVVRKIGSPPTSLTDGTVVYEGSGEQFVDTGLTNGKTYHYALFAYDEVPNYSVPALVFATPQPYGENTNPPSVVTLDDGILVREEDRVEVWLLKRTSSGKLFRRHVLSPRLADFYHHLQPFWENIHLFPRGALASVSRSAWIRLPLTEDPLTWRIFEVNDDGTKHWITCVDSDHCGSIWIAHGGDPDGIYTVNAAELASYVTGPNVFLR